MDSPKGCINNLKEGTLYYGVFTPNDNKDYSNSPNVFEDKLEALKVAKKNKKSRFKAFQFYHEAAEFALNGSEYPNNNTTVNGPLSQIILSEPTQTIGEKASPFKGPKPQELVELRKAIEGGNYKLVKDTIWQNPRYLVSSGDTPSILQEGPRYNALHVAAKSKNAEITELVLTTVSDTDFIKLLYGDDNQQNAEDRTSVLLDLYLNTPNKGLNETPLHFASKYGAADVVEILVSYPQCDRTLINKFQKTADQIICERAEGDNLSVIRKKIGLLLQDSYYVPVLRAEDNSMPPVIGEPFLPTSPPVLNVDVLCPRLEIHAYAGPMNKKGAQEFRKIWKTPPRSLSLSSPNLKNPVDLTKVSALRFKDPQKGLERIGKQLANKYEVNWKEYWPFLDSFIDISSEEGLKLLENYLSNRYITVSKSFTEDKEKSPELSRSDPLSPISNLCAAFSACHLNDSSRSQILGGSQKSDTDSIVYIDKACQVFANLRNGVSLPVNHNQIELSSDDDCDNEEFYTPPSSPSLLENSESEDEFNDTELPKYDVFIEGDYPTKLDCEVFNALNYSECILDSKKYPNIYSWYHNVSLYPVSERQSWTSSKDVNNAKSHSPNASLSASFSVDSPRTSTPSKSWLRITGANSPRALFKSYSMNV
ncbi:hypothetical protein NQ314_005270 [Rhamnusium bicolor]|uniref:ANKLE2 third alpha/beta domain-containing protein n=1 Tax=Rhamnusium bicolor TaxID=1586634 RepID=A0AAV8ZJL8_9CUCU|nr:hypothetical protein NQ314_005270 [Rhamnusium bicolor]